MSGGNQKMLCPSTRKVLRDVAPPMEGESEPEKLFHRISSYSSFFSLLNVLGIGPLNRSMPSSKVRSSERSPKVAATTPL
ncbi:hypothetical protein R1flu_023482 [Riccia fluitans]|uniref:Uncharacterized protein n=1 Tax=Riccia fluitans TaxID=41844 RepID=A0ABD1XS58_9MARC